MNLFDQKNTSEISTKERELDEQLSAKGAEVTALSEELGTLQKKIDSLKQEYLRTTEELAKKQESFMRDLGNRKDDLSEKLKQLEEEQSQLKLWTEAKDREIEERIEELKQKKASLTEEREVLEQEEFKKKKAEIETTLKDLRKQRKQAGADYNLKARELRDEFDSLVKQRNEEIEGIKAEKIQYEADAEKQIADLEDQIEKTRLAHADALKELEVLQQERVAASKEAEEIRIKEKQDELERQLKEYDELDLQRQDKVRELEQVREEQEEELHRIRLEQQERRALLQEESDELTRQLEEKTASFEREKADLSSRYENVLNELRELKEKLDGSRNMRAEQFREDLAAHSQEQYAIYEKYLGDLDGTYAKESEERDEELRLLNADLAQEEEQLQERNAFIQERLDQRNAEYDQQIRSVDADVETVRNELSRLQASYKEKEEAHLADLERLKNDNQNEIDTRKAEYDAQVEHTLDEYRQRFDGIQSEINQAKERIGDLNRRIAVILEDNEKYANEHVDRLIQLKQDQEDYRKQIEEKKNETSQEILSVEQKLEEEKTSFEQRSAEADQERIRLGQDHEEELKALEQEHVAQLDELKRRHEEQMNEALSAHEQKLASLQEEHAARMNAAREEFDRKQKEYEAAAASLDQEMESSRIQTEERIAALKSEEEQLQKDIVDVKSRMKQEEDDYSRQMEELPVKQQETLEQMAKEKDEEFARIEEEYETVPTRELGSVKDEYEQKQQEYSQTEETVAQKRQQLEEEETSLRAQLDQQKQNADRDLSLRTADLEQIRSQAQKQEEALEEESARMSEELDRFHQELDRSVEEIRLNRKKEYEELCSRLDEEYAHAADRCRQAEEDAKAESEKQIAIRKEDLGTRQKALESLLSQIELKKQTTERECQDRYEAAQRQTSEMKTQLEDLLKEEERQRTHMTSDLDHRRQIVSGEIERIRQAYEQIRTEKIAAYERYLSQVKEKYGQIRKEIADLEEKKQRQTAELAAYEEQKREELEQMRSSTAEYLDGITAQIENISEQIARTNESHDQRISYLKTEIASTMSEYDTLLRSKPEVLSAAENDEAFDLTARTQQMKDKMNELEQLHGSVMLELGKKRDEILNAVAAQIDALEAGKADSLRKYEDEISGISLAYDALCRDEKVRQDVLSQEIAKASEEQRLFLENMHNEELSAIEDFESEKRHLDEIHQESLKSSSEQFAAISEELKRSFGKLVSERGVLIDDLDKIMERYKALDDEIARKELELKYECNSRLLDARKQFEADRVRQSEKLNELDVFHDDVEDLFRS